MKNELELFDCRTARELVSEKWYTLEELSSFTGLGKDRLNQLLPEFCNHLQNSFKLGGYHNTQKLYSENVLKALKEYQLKNSVPNAVKDRERYIDSHSEWYTIEELAELSGFSVETLKGGHSPLNEFGIGIETESKIVNMGGHRNVKLYSENVLKALKEYQLKNSVPNAVKDRETAISGNVSFVQTETVKQTISNLLDNPNTIEMLLQESLKRTQALGIENKQLKDIVEKQKPKVDYFDSYMDASNLSEIGQLGKVTKIGERNIFKVMVADGYIRGKCVDGIFYYVPNYGYERYFETIPVPFTKQGKQLSRDKLMLTKEGFVYFMKKYKSN